MNELKQLLSKRWFWLTGAGGFGFGMLFSLLAGNLMETSIKRGLFGFAVMWLAIALIRVWVLTFVSPPSELSSATADQAVVSGESGTHFDVSLPAESPGSPPVASDFQPWGLQKPGESLDDTQVQNFVDAIRTIQQ
jgi:hypothetical protein